MKDEKNNPDPEIEQAWIKEVDRRAKEVEEGEVNMISPEEFEQMRRAKKKN